MKDSLEVESPAMSPQSKKRQHSVELVSSSDEYTNEDDDLPQEHHPASFTEDRKTELKEEDFDHLRATFDVKQEEDVQHLTLPFKKSKTNKEEFGRFNELKTKKEALMIQLNELKVEEAEIGKRKQAVEKALNAMKRKAILAKRARAQVEGRLKRINDLKKQVDDLLD